MLNKWMKILLVSASSFVFIFTLAHIGVTLFNDLEHLKYMLGYDVRFGWATIVSLTILYLLTFTSVVDYVQLRREAKQNV